MTSGISDADERHIILANDVESLVDLTRYAQKSNRFTQPPDTMYLGGVNREMQLWGADAARDFIETNWRDVISYLLEVGAARDTRAVILMPIMGYRALKEIQAFVHKALPGCKVSVPGPMMTIDWADLI